MYWVIVVSTTTWLENNNVKVSKRRLRQIFKLKACFKRPKIRNDLALISPTVRLWKILNISINDECKAESECMKWSESSWVLPAASRCLWAVHCWFHNHTLSSEQTPARCALHITLFFGNQLCEWVAGCVWNHLNGDAVGQEKSVMTVSQLWLIRGPAAPHPASSMSCEFLP